jgi:hypothetical protein
MEYTETHVEVELNMCYWIVDATDFQGAWPTYDYDFLLNTGNYEGGPAGGDGGDLSGLALTPCQMAALLAADPALAAKLEELKGKTKLPMEIGYYKVNGQYVYVEGPEGGGRI